MQTRAKTLIREGVRSIFVEFEKRAEAIYMRLARRFRDNTELSGFWLGMSLAERQHAVILSFCERQHLLTEVPSVDSPSILQSVELLLSLEDRAAQLNLSLDDAFMIAADLERSEINTIYERLVGPVEGTSYLVRKKIETMGANHLQIIVQAARRFGVSRSVIESMIPSAENTVPVCRATEGPRNRN